jgi:DNA-binding winged helix-turn-helix (wHTH) protein/Tol biopolymer transport system component
MRWQIKGFLFCDQQHTLTIDEKVVRLEPMMSELLTYFCRHQNEVVSKEQLLDDVWQGRYVSDNTVSKLITKLRKALDDDARNPKFIVTIPKRGYRFVAEANEMVVPQDSSEQNAAKLVNPNKAIWPWAVVFTLVIAVGLWMFSNSSKYQRTFISAKAVTSDKGSEFFPSFAADGVRLAYMNHDGEKFRLYVKNVFSGEQVEVNHGAKNGVGPGSWNDSGNKLVYLVATQENCQYFVRKFDGMTMSEPKLIYTCKKGSFGAIKFTHDDNVVVFAESPGIGEPYSLYSLDIVNNQKTWLPQPELHLGGNSQFDLHPTENKLLISSPNEQQWEGFYQLNLDNKELSLLFELNAFICCGIWSHDGEHVVLMGEHPAREIVRFDLDGSNKTTLYTDTQQIHRPERHSNGVDYSFTAFKYDLNVDEYHIGTEHHSSILDDTFDERLAVLSPDNARVAYVNFSSGNEEIWLYERETHKKRKVTQFADGRHYVDLTWSPNQEKLAALTLNSIHIVDVDSGAARILPVPEKEIRGVSFKSDEQISYSVKLADKWQVIVMNLRDDTMTRLEPNWQSVRFDREPANWLWVDQNNNWYLGQEKKPISLPVKPKSPFYGRQFSVAKSGENIVLYDWPSTKLMIFERASGELKSEILTQIGHFSLNKDILLVSQKSSNSNDSDIYRTYSIDSN